MIRGRVRGLAVGCRKPSRAELPASGIARNRWLEPEAVVGCVALRSLIYSAGRHPSLAWFYVDRAAEKILPAFVNKNEN